MSVPLDQSIFLLSFIRDLISLPESDCKWVTSQGSSLTCDVSEVYDWFYQILLPNLLMMDDLSPVLRIFVEALLGEVYK